MNWGKQKKTCELGRVSRGLGLSRLCLAQWGPARVANTQTSAICSLGPQELNARISWEPSVKHLHKSCVCSCVTETDLHTACFSRPGGTGQGRGVGRDCVTPGPACLGPALPHSHWRWLIPLGSLVALTSWVTGSCLGEIEAHCVGGFLMPIPP